MTHESRGPTAIDHGRRPRPGATALTVLLGLALGCGGDTPTAPGGGPVELHIRAVFEEGGGARPATRPAPARRGLPVFAAVDRVLAKVIDTGEELALAEQELQITDRVASGRLTLTVEGTVQAEVLIEMFDGATPAFRGSEPVELRPGARLSPEVLMRDVPASGVRGQVENALQAVTISGATVRLVEPVLTTTTGADGSFEIRVDPGTYTLRVTAQGFVQAPDRQVSVVQEEVTDIGVVALVPVQEEGEVAIVLGWGQSPGDLDAHLTGPLAAGSRFHVYFGDAGSRVGEPFAQLDRDDRGSFGPETVTIARRSPGVYRYSVHDYSNRGSTTSSALSGSGAQVRVIMNSQEVENISIQAGNPGTLWRVFEMDGATGAITVLDTLLFWSDARTVE